MQLLDPGKKKRRRKTGAPKHRVFWASVRDLRVPRCWRRTPRRGWRTSPLPMRRPFGAPMPCRRWHLPRPRRGCCGWTARRGRKGRIRGMELQRESGGGGACSQRSEELPNSFALGLLQTLTCLRLKYEPEPQAKLCFGVHSLRLTWKLPEGLCKWNSVF